MVCVVGFAVTQNTDLVLVVWRKSSHIYSLRELIGNISGL